MKNQFTNQIFSKLRYLFLVSVFMLSVTSVFATHFRYGNITWQRVPGSPNKVKFKVTQAWRKTFYTTTHNSFQIGSVVATANFNFGDGSPVTPVNMKITAMNLSEDWIYGEWTYTKTYAGPGTFVVSYTNCCKITELVNNANTQALVTSIVQVGNGNDAPVASIPPYINFSENKPFVSYQIPSVDPNGDPLTYTLAPNGSFGAAGVVQPTDLAVSPSGLVTWNTIGKTLGQQYNANIKVTDSKGAQVTVDFIIRIVGQSTPSEFDYTVSPPSGTTFEVQPGDPIGFQIKAGDSDTGGSTTLIPAGLPTGSNFNTVGTNPVTGTFNWTPADSQQGTYVVNITAQDNVGVQTSTTINLDVSYKPRFDVPFMPGNNSYFVVKPGDSITHPIKAYHPDASDAVVVTVPFGSKPAMTFNPALPFPVANPVTAGFKWIPSLSDWGLNKVVYKAVDTFHKAVAYDTIYYIVDNPPVITSAPDTNAKAGQPFTYVLKATDLDSIFGDKLKVEEITLPSFLTLTQNSYGQWTITGTPGANHVGDYYINIEVADSMNHIGGTHLSNAVQAFTLHVLPQAGGLNFDGVNDYARVASPYASFGKEITVDFYASIDPTSKIGSGISQSTENIDGTSHMMWMMHYSPTNNVMQFYISDNGVWKHADATVLPGVHRYTGVAGANGIMIYVDGVLAATSADVVKTGILNVANSVMHFGKDSRYAAGRFMKGQIDEVRIWNRALCASELQHYNSCEVPTPNNGLVEYYKFNQGHVGADNSSINTVADASGNNKTATLHNMTLTGTASNWVAGSINSACAAYVAPVASITAGGSTTVCYGESVGLTANAGASYQWFKNGVAIPNATSQAYTATQSGAYTVTVYTAGGCSGGSPVANVTVTPQLSVAGNVTNALIFGTNTGSINVTAAGGTAPYSYAWSNNATTEDISGIGTGAYSVVVTDAINCSASKSFSVSQPAQLLATASVNNALIYNTNTGAINLNVTGGVGPYTYSWSNNASTEDLAAIGAGTYTVTITDANGASFTATYTITQPDPLTATGVVTNATIFNLANGGVNITPAGGVGPYTYSWSNNATTEDLAAVGAGTYAVTITDANGATFSASYIITQPDPLTVGGVVTNATIYNVANGAVNITAAGGVGPYTYSWSNNSSNEDLAAIGAGTYTVTITDANGATATGNYTVTQPAQLLATASVSNALIYNTNTGAIDINVTGGVGPYTYSWSNSASTEDLTGVGAGTYTVTVTDANGAVFTASYTITQPAQLTVAGVVTNATIYNVANGGIDITPAGGVGPYTYQWNGNVTTEDRTNIAAGAYNVTVTDANGATATATYQVTQPAQLVVTGLVTNATIFGVSNGGINITAAGGVGPYTYLWNGNVTTEDRNNIPAGTYTVTVTDSKGATKTSVFTVTQPTQLNGTISVNPVYSVNNNHAAYTLFKGYRDYTYLTAVPTGGIPGYTYSWSPTTGCANPNSATTKVTPAATTTYTVTITDSKGATKTVSQTINVIDVRCYAGNSPAHKIYVCHNGKNTICIDTNALSTHLNQHGDLVGRCEDYANKNSYSEEEHNDHSDALSAIGEVEKNIVLFPNPSDGRFTVKLPALTQDGQLIVRDIMGRIVSMSTVVSSEVEQTLQIDLSTVAKGTYVIMVSSGNELYRSSMLVQ